MKLKYELIVAKDVTKYISKLQPRAKKKVMEILKHLSESPYIDFMEYLAKKKKKIS